ncbi:MAG: class 1 fructose-bisphosphatase [Halovenus sp.]
MSESVEAIFRTVAEMASDVRGVLGKRRSYMDEENPTGDRQLAADVYADELLEERLLALDAVSSYASEERDGVVDDTGRYHIVCDPLDGSSNLQSNNSMGTIVGVYSSRPPATGEELVAASYVLYGPILTMVTAHDGTVTEYLIENRSRTELTADLEIPEDPTVYGFGGRAPDWTDKFSSYVASIEDDRLKLRYSGAMVGDVTQVLIYGGIFGYPMLVDAPEGKLRLQFEGQPIAYIVESAGGASSDGTQSLLETRPEQVHDRSPLFVGNEDLIAELEASL